jgi:FAD/FMN-containing dehydrogenase
MDVWGPIKNDFALMQGIKKALDPQNLFSPGRFLGRL